MGCVADRGCMNNRSDHLRNAIFIIGESFAVISVIWFAVTGDWERAVLSAATIGLVALPRIVELLFKRDMNIPLYFFCTLYSAGHMAGHVYYLYYLLPWWDDLLHFAGGVIFALLGIELSRALCRGKSSEVSFLLIALSGFCFSVTLSVLWEFAEYLMDVLFALDMQSDRIIHSLSSFNLGNAPGIRGTVENINEVIINGQPLGVGGYIDIGLIDTMSDLLLEALGAFIVSLILVFRKGRLDSFRKSGKDTAAAKKQE